MLQVLLAVEIVLAITLVAVILLQRSEGGALGMGGGAGIGGLLSARGTANLLTRATAVLAVAFIAVALLLANLAGKRGDTTSVFDAPAAVPAVSQAPAETTGDGLPALEVPPEDQGEGTAKEEDGGN